MWGEMYFTVSSNLYFSLTCPAESRQFGITLQTFLRLPFGEASLMLVLVKCCLLLIYHIYWGCHNLDCKLDIDQNDVMISAFEIKGGIVDFTTPPVSCPAGVPKGKIHIACCSPARKRYLLQFEAATNETHHGNC